MKKLYDEIMGLYPVNTRLGDDYQEGFDEALYEAAELAKKYDTRIAELENLLANCREHLNIIDDS